MTTLFVALFVCGLVEAMNEWWEDLQYRRYLAEELRAAWKEEEDHYRYRYRNLPL